MSTLSHFISFHSIHPNTFYSNSTWKLIAAKTILHVIAPFTCPLPTICKVVSPLSISLTSSESSNIFFSSFPLDFALTFHQSIFPFPFYSSTIIQNGNTFSMKFIIQKQTLVHSIIKIIFPFAGFLTFHEMAFIVGVIRHFLLAETIRLVIFPFTFV